VGPLQGDAHDAETAADALAKALEASGQDWKVALKEMTDACKSCHETSAPTRRKGNIISSAQKAYGNIALRFAAIALFALGLLSPVNVTRAESEVRCPESGMPIETLGSEKEQRQVLYQQAKACVNGGKPLQAVALLSRVIKSDPTDAVAYLNRGSAQAAAGEVALALSDFSVAINLDPNLVEAWYNRGTTFTHIRRFESAIADFTEAIRLKPDLALAYCNRGLANVQLGRYDEALVDYVVAIDRDPKLTYCYFNRGSLYLTLGDYQKAINDLTEALKERGGDPVALTRRAQAYEALGRKSEALDDFRAALDANPKLESAQEGFERIMTEQQQSERHK
jgi:tetratricopeptide (TPR) repeat protein